MRRLCDLSVSLATVLHFERLMKEHVDRPYVKYFLYKTMQLMNIKLLNSYKIWETPRSWEQFGFLRGGRGFCSRKSKTILVRWTVSLWIIILKKSKHHCILVPMYFCLHEMFIVSYSLKKSYFIRRYPVLNLTVQ